MKWLNSLIRVVVILLAIGLFVHFSGFGTRYTVSGKVTRGGKPIEWQSASTLLTVHFAPVDRKNNRALYPAVTDTAAGTYVINNVPAGDYLVAVHMLDPSPMVDALNLNYNLVNSPLTYRVTGDAIHDIDVPLHVPKMSKGPKGPSSKGETKDKD